VSRFLKMAELRDAIQRGVEIQVITRPLVDKKQKVSESTFSDLAETVKVYLRDGFHEKIIVLDDQIAYVGSANILAWPSGSDVMQRIADSETTRELLEKVILPKEEEKVN